jgi:hypothetical protein
MKLEKMWTVGLVIGLTLAAGSAFADSTKRQCVIDAKQQAQTCRQLCSDDFLASIDSCRGVDHDCADTARAARESCVSDVLTELNQCITTNCATFVQLIADCRTQFAAGTPERDACVDGQQLLLFQCRDSCRESVKVWASLKTCRQEFKTDIKACPAAPATPKVMGP